MAFLYLERIKENLRNKSAKGIKLNNLWINMVHDSTGHFSVPAHIYYINTYHSFWKWPVLSI